MTGKKFQLYLTALKIPLDAIVIFLAFFLAYKIRIIGANSEIVTQAMPLNQFLHWVIMVIPIWIVIFGLTKLYQFQKKAFSDELASILVATSAGMMIVFTFLFFGKFVGFSRLIILYSWIFVVVFVVFERLLIRAFEKLIIYYGKGKTRVLIIGTGNTAQKIVQEFFNPNSNYIIIGYINGDETLKNCTKLGTIQNFEKIIRANKIEEVYQTDKNLTDSQTKKVIAFCESNGVRFKFAPSIFKMKSKNIEIQSISDIPIIELKRSPLDGWGRIVKRIVDLLFSFFAIIILTPVMLIISIAIKLDSRGPILFRQRRVGKNNKLFTFLKFRSMYAGAHKEHLKMMKKHGVMFKLKNDPRTTKVGRFLRKTSLDELPQLFNIFIGSMSLVGPRPPMPEEVGKYNNWQKKRLGFKPGLTGLWQVSGRSDISFDEWVKMDVYYIENWSLKLDIQILLKTFWVILTKKGAY